MANVYLGRIALDEHRLTPHLHALLVRYVQEKTRSIPASVDDEVAWRELGGRCQGGDLGAQEAYPGTLELGTEPREVHIRGHDD